MNSLSIVCGARKGMLSQLRPAASFNILPRAGLAAVNGSGSSSANSSSSVGSTNTAKRYLRAISNPPMLPPPPPMTLRYHYMGLVLVFGIGIWAYNQPDEAFRKHGFSGVFDMVADDDDVDDDDDDDFSDILGKPREGDSTEKEGAAAAADMK